MNTAVVTGANGFIGKALCKALLKRQVKVYAIIREGEIWSDQISPYLQVVNLDMENYDKLPEFIKEEIEVFFHFAWNGTFGPALTDYNLQLSNVKLACDAICAANKIKTHKFIFAGTVNELEIKGFLNQDTFEPRLAAIYGTTKLTSEMLLKILAYSFGMEINIGIIGSTYGEGDRSRMVQNIIIKHLLEGKSPKLISGDSMYDWVYIEDIVLGFIHIAQKGISQKSYYIGHQELRKFKDIVTEVRDIINPNVDLQFGELQDKMTIDFSTIDINALANDTGYKPQANFKESILKTAEWVKNLDITI